jgi:uncharacterized heparinase superfamily protein
MTAPAAALGRLWRTVRWLRPEQVWGRVRFRLDRPHPDGRPAPARRVPSGPWIVPAARGPSLVGPTRMRFLAEPHDLDEVGWDDPALALLWRYNQHYFDDLNAAGAGQRRDWHRALVERWRVQNPPGRGTAFAPYPASLRIVNWIKWFLGGAAAEPAWLDSLALQARWLERRLEWHLLGNHLFANAKALVHAGLFFEGAEADRWLATGLEILDRELPEQVLADGGHFERSPMYHGLALEDLLDLLNVAGALAPAGSSLQPRLAGWRERASVMLHWLRCLRHPDGTLARFNDCAEGIAPPAQELERLAAALSVEAAPARGEGVHALQPSGYVRVVRGAAVALLDVAPVGPDYLPGHAHADTLSFELSVRGRELIVNRGTSVYGTGPRRQRERGTAAHSTLQLGGTDSSEVWSGFRVGRRARPGPLHLNGWTIEASHDGYVHRPGKPRHHRRWEFLQSSLLVVDRLEPPSPEPAVVRFHLAPGLDLRGGGAQWTVIDDSGATIAHADILAGHVAVERWDHAARFGVLVPAQTLAVEADATSRSAVRWSW